MNCKILVFSLLVVCLQYVATAQIVDSPSKYCNGEFYLDFENDKRIAFVLPKESGLGRFAMVGRGKFKPLKDSHFVEVSLEYGYNPTISSVYVFETIREIPTDSTEFYIDTADFEDFGSLQASYSEACRRKVHRCASDRNGFLPLNWNRPVYQQIVDLSTFSFGIVRISVDSLVGKAIRVRPLVNGPARKKYLGAAKGKEFVRLRLRNLGDSLKVNFENSNIVTTLYRCR